MNHEPKKIGKYFEIAYEKVNEDVKWLHINWKLVKQLFGTEEKVSIWNEVASTAGRLIQDALIDNVILQTTKLGDPAKSWKNYNLSMKQLIERLPSDVDPELEKQLGENLEKFHKCIENLKLHRDKSIAHKDLDHAIFKTLPPIFVKDIDEALNLIRMFMHKIQKYYKRGKELYEHIIFGMDGDLLDYIQQGQLLINISRDAQSGNATPAEIMERVKQAI